jgi:hypothetical protein
VIGQAVLGFVLPWILAMVAIPLEMLLDSGRHVLAGLCILALTGLGALGRAGAYLSSALSTTLVSVYEIYISIPLRIERAVREPRTSS